MNKKHHILTRFIAVFLILALIFPIFNNTVIASEINTEESSSFSEQVKDSAKKLVENSSIVKNVSLDSEKPSEETSEEKILEETDDGPVLVHLFSARYDNVEDMDDRDKATIESVFVEGQPETLSLFVNGVDEGAVKNQILSALQAFDLTVNYGFEMCFGDGTSAERDVSVIFDDPFADLTDEDKVKQDITDEVISEYWTYFEDTFKDTVLYQIFNDEVYEVEYVIDPLSHTVSFTVSDDGVFAFVSNVVIEETEDETEVEESSDLEENQDEENKIEEVIEKIPVEKEEVQEEEYDFSEDFEAESFVTLPESNHRLLATRELEPETNAWTSGEESKTFTLKPGTYTMTETTAPDGYEVAESITFIVTMDGKVMIDGREVDKVVMKDAPKLEESKPEEIANQPNYPGLTPELKPTSKHTTEETPTPTIISNPTPIRTGDNNMVGLYILIFISSLIAFIRRKSLLRV